jgi:hypothetical protein
VARREACQKNNELEQGVTSRIWSPADLVARNLSMLAPLATCYAPTRGQGACNAAGRPLVLGARAAVWEIGYSVYSAVLAASWREIGYSAVLRVGLHLAAPAGHQDRTRQNAFCAIKRPFCMSCGTTPFYKRAWWKIAMAGLLAVVKLKLKLGWKERAAGEPPVPGGEGFYRKMCMRHSLAH